MQHSMRYGIGLMTACRNCGGSSAKVDGRCARASYFQGLEFVAPQRAFSELVKNELCESSATFFEVHFYSSANVAKSLKDAAFACDLKLVCNSSCSLMAIQ